MAEISNIHLGGYRPHYYYSIPWQVIASSLKSLGPKLHPPRRRGTMSASHTIPKNDFYGIRKKGVVCKSRGPTCLGGSNFPLVFSLWWPNKSWGPAIYDTRIIPAAKEQTGHTVILSPVPWDLEFCSSLFCSQTEDACGRYMMFQIDEGLIGWVVATQIFLEFSPLFGEMIHFD